MRERERGHKIYMGWTQTSTFTGKHGEFSLTKYGVNNGSKTNNRIEILNMRLKNSLQQLVHAERISSYFC